MKKLNLVIKCCGECPYIYYDDEMASDFCPNAGEILNDEKIHKDCPLEDTSPIATTIPTHEQILNRKWKYSETNEWFTVTSYDEVSKLYGLSIPLDNQEREWFIGKEYSVD